MNTRDSAFINRPLTDVQGSADTRHIAINKVGIKAIRHPVNIASRDGAQASVATFSMSVALPEHLKGTHMSRFVRILGEQQVAVSQPSFETMLRDTAALLEADTAHIEMRFPFFITKTAPVSGVKSLMDYEVEFAGQVQGGKTEFTVKVQVPVTSLCPCSKEISDYGAHNQRSHITVKVAPKAPLPLEDLIELVEGQGSCELYGLLKRPDEKYVTERAYDNPKFVEDLIRDVAIALNADVRVGAYTIEVENFESIHNHSAYAVIEKR
jgi:GTP cyclohydrolase IB